MEMRARKARVSLLAMAVAYAPMLAIADEIRPIDVPAQPLADAITELGTETGLRIVANANEVANKQSVTVRGAMDPRDALQKLLTGTGLKARLVSENNAVVSQNRNVSEGEQDLLNLGTLILQGEQIPRALQDSTTSAFVETGDYLENSPNTSVVDVLNRAGNVTTSGAITIRGISQGGQGNRTIGVVVDGVRVSDDVSFGPLSTWDLEQVEVLRGPQSTQKGRNALAGAIYVKSRDPIFEDEYRARLRFGSLDGSTDLSTAASLNQVLIEDKLALRLSYEGRGTEGLVRHPNPAFNTNFARREDKNLRASLRWDPTDRFSAILKYTFIDQERNPDRNTLDIATFLQTGQRISRAPLDRFGDLKDHRWNLRLRYDITDNLHVESETTYWDRFVEFGNRDNSSNVFRPNTSIEEEIKLVYDAERLKAAGGLFYTDTTLDQVLVITNPGFRPANVFQRRSENYAIFGEVEYEALTGLRLIAGARYDTETSKVLAGRFVALPSLPGQTQNVLAPGNQTNATYEAFLPKLGLVYEFNDNVSLGFVAQQAYRAGGSGIVLLSGRVFDFDPEFTDNYELSLRSNFFEERLFVNANLFFTDWRDQQVRTLAPGSTNPFDVITTNAGSSQLWGGELEIRATPTSQMDLYASVGYTETEFKDFTVAAVDANNTAIFNPVNGLPVFTNVAGNEFANAPNWSGSIGGQYRFNSGVWVAADVTYEGSSFTNVQNTLRQSSRFLVNARVGYEYKNWSVIGYVENIFDDEYINGAPLTNPTTGFTLGGVTEPREVGFILQAKF